MKLNTVLLAATLFLVGCEGHQETGEGALDLGNPLPAATAIRGEGSTVDVPLIKTPLGTGQAVAGGGATPASVLHVGQFYVMEAQAALLPSSVIAYCKAFAQQLTEPGDLKACIGLVQMPDSTTQDLPTVTNLQQLVEAAASRPLVQRFALCTSKHALWFINSFAEFDRCMPPNLQAALETQLADLKFKRLSEFGGTPPGFPYPDPLSTAAQLAPELRAAYCGIPDVASQLQGDDKQRCVNGIAREGGESASNTDSDDQFAVNPDVVLLNASRMRSQTERTAFCTRPDIAAALTPSQRNECLEGLSPTDPPANVRTDDDPRYRDQGL